MLRSARSSRYRPALFQSPNILGCVSYLSPQRLPNLDVLPSLGFLKCSPHHHPFLKTALIDLCTSHPGEKVSVEDRLQQLGKRPFERLSHRNASLDIRSICEQDGHET